MCSADLAADSAQLWGSQTLLTAVTSVISFDFSLSFKVSADWIMFNCCLNTKGQKGINKPAAFTLTHVITLRLMEQKRVRPPGVNHWLSDPWLPQCPSTFEWRPIVPVHSKDQSQILVFWLARKGYNEVLCSLMVPLLFYSYDHTGLYHHRLRDQIVIVWIKFKV